MDKKVKFSDRPLSVKIVYIATLAILVICIAAVGIISIASRKDGDGQDQPLQQPSENDGGSTPDSDGEGEGEPSKPAEEKPTFTSPVIGTVSQEHSMSELVFSETLKQWSTHNGIDIITDENCAVYAAADGIISAIYDDPCYGRTVEITHSMNYKTVYSNLAKEDAAFVSVGDTVASGDRIGTVGYTSIFEIGDEPHLHFEMKSNNKAVNPLAHITSASKESSLGIKDGSAT